MAFRNPSCYGECTDYPRLYIHSYWGCQPLRYDEKEHPPEKAIIDARNKFVVDHRIVSSKKNGYCFRISDLDHQEFWVDQEKRIVHIYSEPPYRGIHPGFKEISPLYHPGGRTCLRKMETPYSKKLLMKTLFARIPDDAVALVNAYLITPKKQRAKKARHF